MDANRRQRESDAITRLHRLIRTVAADGEAEDESAEGDDEEAESRKAGRLTVLESSIALIEQLTTACKRMEAACNAKDAQVSKVSSQLRSVAAAIAQQATSLTLVDQMEGFTAALLPLEYSQPRLPSLLPASRPASPALLGAASSLSPSFLSVLPPAASSYLLRSDMSHTLRQSTMSLMNSMSVTVVVVPSMVIIDVNERFLEMTGHMRAEIMYHSMHELGMMNAVN